MSDVNPFLVNLLYQSSISGLPNKKRQIYQYIERKELELEEIAVSEKHFVQLMYNNSPFKDAADFFSLDITTVKNIMDEVQGELDLMMAKRLSRIKWIDYSDRIKKHKSNEQKNWTFVFLS